jgi:hypothetical protein
MHEPWEIWQTTKIRCPSCKSPILRRNRLVTTRSEYNYCCVQCGVSWPKKPENRTHERSRVTFVALLVVISIAFPWGLHAAAQSMCREVITDGKSMCIDVPTYHESLHSHGEMGILVLVSLGAIWVIPLIAGATVRRRNWSRIVSVSIVAGIAAGFVVGPLVVQYRHEELYWSNPSLLGEMIRGALGLIILSLPISVLATWIANRQPHVVR